MQKETKNLSKEDRVSKIIADARLQVGALGPAEIVDQEAYDEFIELCNNPVFHTLKLQKTSTGKEINVANLPSNLKKLITHLPKAEQKRLMNLNKLHNDLLCKRNAKLKQAFKMQIKREDGVTTRLTAFSQREQQMVELFGRMFSVAEVHAVCLQEWKIPVTAAAVGDFRTAHWKEISAKIEVHKRDFSDIRLGYKRSRLEELTWLYQTRRTIYELTKKADDHRLLLQTVEQIRKEVEGDIIRMDGKLTMDIELTVQQQIQKELFRYLPIKEIILARIAARSGIKPETLIADINKSYYGNYLMRNAEDINHEEIDVYPSTETYDFNRISASHQKLEQEREVVVTVSAKEEAKQAVKDQAQQSIKNNLLAIIRQKQEKLDFTASKISEKLIEKRSAGEVTDFNTKTKNK